MTGWIRRHRTVTIALGVALLTVMALGMFWFGWKALVAYIDPQDATGRKDAVQVYALIVAGVVATVTAAVGLLNLRLTRRSLEQQRELEAQRAQGTALQSYYEQFGNLIPEYDLRNTDREEIRELARGQTLTVLQEVDGTGKGSLLTFLHGAGLIGTENPAVALTGAVLQGANLLGANLQDANLQDANLQEALLRLAILYKADLREAILYKADLQEANLQDASLWRAHLQGADLLKADLQRADLQDANLQGARVTDEQLADVQSLQGATMPDGSKHP